MADRMVADGYKAAGYEYVNIDDCWSTHTRDPTTNKLVPDPERFPSGIKALADYMHVRGLKLGIYGDMGSHTCGGYPGSQFTLELDAQTFAEWEVDSFKMDGCNCDPHLFDNLFPMMTDYLNKTGRPILFSCEWPLYQKIVGITPNYTRIANYCNIWRNDYDVEDTWDSVLSIIEFYGTNAGNFTEVAGPGAFNDPDMVIVGDPGLSISEQQVQMAMWAIFAAPLFVSSDLRTIDPTSRDLLLNKRVIAINQDALGIMGKRVAKTSHTETWIRKIQPKGSYAVAVLNKSGGGYKVPVTFTLTSLDPEASGTFSVMDVFTGYDVGTFRSDQNFTVWVDTSSVVFNQFTLLF